MGKSTGEGATGNGDDPREAAMAAALPLQPDFLSRSVNRAQINKLKELHQRRLQMKALISSKHQKNPKDAGVKEVNAKKIDVESQPLVAEAFTETSCVKNKVISGFGSYFKEESSSYPWKKRQKLHWGLDTKERWERKANM